MLGTYHARNLVWNGSEWIPETQPGGGGGGGGPIQDGVDPTIEATVHHYTDSNPLAVILTDTNGDPLAGSAVSIADGADVAEGATTDAGVGDSNGTVNAHLRQVAKVLSDVWDSVNHLLKVSIQNATLAVTQSGSWVLSAGSALIGKVGIDQTTPGTTNGVQVNAALPAGTNVIGHVIADTGSTTVVTGNVAGTVADGANVVEGAVADAAATAGGAGTLSAKLRAISRDLIANIVLAAGSAIIGKVGIDQTTPGTTNGVQVNAALPAGTNLLGNVGIDQTTEGVTNAVRTGIQQPVANTFTGVHVPATNTQATTTKGSAGAGKRNVCTGFTFTFAAGASAITAATPLIVSVIDGVSGGTTYLYRSYINIPAVAGVQVSIVRSGLWLVGSQATALTVEFSAAGGPNSYESVAVDGVVVTE